MIFRRRLPSIIFIFVASNFSACSSDRSVIPISEKSQSIYHTVVPKDTLYSIAWRYDVDFVALAKANKLKPPYLIHSGQHIYLNAKPVTTEANGVVQQKTNIIKQPSNTIIRHDVQEPVQSISPTQMASDVKWQWPSTGTIAAGFGSQNGLEKGIDLSGKLGQPVNAAATGTVVYAGSGLLGYGQLIILKHNDQYLSAYGHNSELLVKENDKVVVGQKIALMGATGTNNVKLHFEIRKEGKPVDPLGYLPAR